MNKKLMISLIIIVVVLTLVVIINPPFYIQKSVEVEGCVGNYRMPLNPLFDSIKFSRSFGHWRGKEYNVYIAGIDIVRCFCSKYSDEEFFGALVELCNEMPSCNDYSQFNSSVICRSPRLMFPIPIIK